MGLFIELIFVSPSTLSPPTVPSTQRQKAVFAEFPNGETRQQQNTQETADLSRANARQTRDTRQKAFAVCNSPFAKCFWHSSKYWILIVIISLTLRVIALISSIEHFSP